MTLAKSLDFLRSNNLYNSATKELLGSNIPHLAMVMNKFEFLDQAITQLGNTFVVFFKTNLLSKGLDKVHKALQPEVYKSAEGLLKHRNAVKWNFISKDLFLLGNVTSYMLGAPGLRNGITALVSKTTDFISMVGLNGDKKEDPAVVKPYAHQNLLDFAKVYGSSLGLFSLAALAAHLAGRKNLPIPKALSFMHKKLGLPSGKYHKMKDWSAVLMWAYPVYAGLYGFSRDKAEGVETAVKAFGFSAAFAILPRTVEKGILHFTKSKVFPVVGSGENMAFLGQLLSAIVFYTAIPTTLNLLYRKKRAAKFGLLDAEKTQVLPAETPLEQTKAPVVAMASAGLASPSFSTLPVKPYPSGFTTAPLSMNNSLPPQPLASLSPAWVRPVYPVPV
jgi:hypothetical protein